MSLHPAGFELTVSTDERPQTYPLYRAVAGTGGLLDIVALNEIEVSYSAMW
jgi:hypothetical protein